MKGRLVAALVIAFSVNAHAVTQLPLLWCDNCTDSQKASATLTYPAGSLVYVADAINQTVDSYQVYTDSRYNSAIMSSAQKQGIMPAAIASKAALWFAPTEPYRSYANSLIAFYSLAPKGWYKSIKLATTGVLTHGGAYDLSAPYSDRTINVYDVIDPGPNQNNLTSWIANSTGSWMNQQSVNLTNLASAFHIVDNNRLPKFEITIKFDDGSQINVKVDLSTTNPHYTIDPKTGIDSHHNNVPATRAAATCSTTGDPGICNYSFDGPGNPTDKQDWQSRMTLLGVTVQGGASSGGHWACTVTGEGPNAVYSCQWFP